MSAASTTESKPAPAAPKPVDLIKIKVDGREIEVPKTMPDWQGKPVPTTMLQACQMAGVEVPQSGCPGRAATPMGSAPNERACSSG